MSALLRVAFFIGDLFFLNISIFYSFSFFGRSLEGVARINCIYLFIFSNLTWFFLFLVSDPYLFSKNDGLLKLIRRQFSFLFVHLLVVVSLIFFFRRIYEPRQLAMMYVFFVPAFFLWKLLIIWAYDYFVRRNTLTRNFVIVGGGPLAMETRRQLRFDAAKKFRFLKLFPSANGNFHLNSIRQFCDSHEVEEIYCCTPDLSVPELRELVDYGMNAMIKVKIIAATIPSAQGFRGLEQHDQTPLINFEAIPLDSKSNLFLKGLFDFVFSVFVMIFILSWLTPIIAIAIKLGSKGPVFFLQQRSGKENKSFYCIKFRTMTVNAESDTRQASRNDARITRLGHFLRKTSLDELPQFLNVLQGTMSVVGPRPHMLRHTEEYSRMLQKFIGRHYVKPGITGLAQARGFRGEIRNIADMKNRVMLDRFYIEHWSFALDLSIIAQTALLVVRQKD